MSEKEKRSLAIQRLTALWALNESGLGGFMHAVNSPFTGLIVGSIAVVLISLICSMAESKFKAISASLLVVLIIKAAVAPHSSLTAYIAVSFQAMAGAFLFTIINSRLIASVLFGVIALVESALQKLLVIYVIYGKTFFEAIDEFGEWAAVQFGSSATFLDSNIVVWSYITIYAFGGFLIGIFISHLLKTIQSQWNDPRYAITISEVERDNQMPQRSGTKKRKIIVIIFILTLIALVAYSLLSGGWIKGIYLISRTIIVLGVWYLLIAPFIYKKIKKYLSVKRAEMSGQVDHIFDMLPYLRIIIRRSWREAGRYSFIRRYYHFILTAILYSLQFKTEE